MHDHTQNKPNVQDSHASLSYTVGLVFLTDLLFLLRLPNFWELLSQPVSVFLEELYGGVGEHDLSREFMNPSSMAPFGQDVIAHDAAGNEMAFGPPGVEINQ